MSFFDCKSIFDFILNKHSLYQFSNAARSNLKGFTAKSLSVRRCSFLFAIWFHNFSNNYVRWQNWVVRNQVCMYLTTHAAMDYLLPIIMAHNKLKMFTRKWLVSRFGGHVFLQFSNPINFPSNFNSACKIGLDIWNKNVLLNLNKLLLKTFLFLLQNSCKRVFEAIICAIGTKKQYEVASLTETGRLFKSKRIYVACPQ